MSPAQILLSYSNSGRIRVETACKENSVLLPACLWFHPLVSRPSYQLMAGWLTDQLTCILSPSARQPILDTAARGTALFTVSGSIYPSKLRNTWFEIKKVQKGVPRKDSFSPFFPATRLRSPEKANVLVSYEPFQRRSVRVGICQRTRLTLERCGA